MYIEKLILENFKFVLHVYHTKRLVLDFTNHKSNICMIAGPNGSGKTFLMSALTPFANLGGVDIRDDSSPIEPKKSGYKEVHLTAGNNHYLIQHFYSPLKESHSVKSFFSCNGEELNPNGNVTSFKELLMTHMGLNPNYMKLLRLGSNVKGLIASKPTERKTIVTERLNESNERLHECLQLNKKAVEVCKETKQEIASIQARLEKLNVTSLEEIEKSLKDTEKEIQRIKDNQEQLSLQKGAILHELQSLGEKEELENTYEALKDTYQEIVTKRKKADRSYSVGELEAKIVEEKESLSKLKVEESTTIAQQEQLLSTLDELYEERKELQNTLDKLQNKGNEYEQLEALRNKARLHYNQNISLYETFHPQVTSEEVKQLIQRLSELQSRMSVVYSFGKTPIEQVIQLMQEGVNVEGYVRESMVQHQLLEEEQASSKRILNDLLDFIDINPKLSCETSTCPALELYKRVNRMRTTKDSIPEESMELLHYMDMVNQNISQTMNDYLNLSPVLSRLPDSLRKSWDWVLDQIRKRKDIYDLNELNTFLMHLSEYEFLQQEQKDILALEEQMHQCEHQQESAFLQKHLETLKGKIEVSESNKQLTISKISVLQQLTLDHTNELDHWTATLEWKLHAKQYEEELILLETSIQRCKELQQRLSKEIIIPMNQLDNQLRIQEQLLYDLQYKKTTYKQLIEELTKQETYYTKMKLIRRGTSTREGIPLKIVERYLHKNKAMINQLLAIAYPKEELRISEFLLDANEFRIPYIKDNKYLIEDVMYASQGEQTFLGTALAVAISSVSPMDIEGDKDPYNVYYFDELDGPLDSLMSSKWIAFLETLLEQLGIEQVFVISHKDMYDANVIDLIVTDPTFDIYYEEEVYPLANFIPVTKVNE